MDRILDNWELIAGAIGSIAAYFTGARMKRINERKADAEADATHIENLDRIFQIQKKQIDELVNDFQAEKTRLKKQLISLVDDLKRENKSLLQLLENKEHIIVEQENVIKRQKELLEEHKVTLKKISASLKYYQKKCGDEKSTT